MRSHPLLRNDIKNDTLNAIHFESLIDIPIPWDSDNFTLTFHTDAIDLDLAGEALTRP